MAQFIHSGKNKKKYVKQMFNDISKTYDLINIISSFGIDRYWRNCLIKKIQLQNKTFVHNSKHLLAWTCCTVGKIFHSTRIKIR